MILILITNKEATGRLFKVNNLHLQQNTNIETLLTMLKKLFVKYNLTSSVQKITEGLQKSTVSECIETHNNENIKHAKELINSKQSRRS